MVKFIYTGQARAILNRLAVAAHQRGDFKEATDLESVNALVKDLFTANTRMCHRLNKLEPGGPGNTPEDLPDIHAEGERIVAETYKPKDGGYIYTDVVGAVQTAIAQERARHLGREAVKGADIADPPAPIATPCDGKNINRCPNMQETGGGFEGERYHCKVCGKGYYLDYEDMK